MKKATIFSLLFAGAFAFQSFAQTNIVKWNPLSLAVSTINLGFESALNDKLSVQLQGFYWLGWDLGDASVDGFGVTPELRFYPSGNAPRGFFVGPFARYQSWSSSTTDFNGGEITGTVTGISGGLNIGGQFIFGDIISLDIYGGPGYASYSVKWDDPDGEGSLDLGMLDGFTFRFGLTVGVAF